MRNRLKVESDGRERRAPCSRCSARSGSLDAYLWSFVGGAPIVNRWRATGRDPGRDRRVAAMSQGYEAPGLPLRGPTVCYAFMQACGMVNDHAVSCFRHREV